MSITVSATTGSFFAALTLAVKVLTGASRTQDGATASSHTTAVSDSITPNASGSLVYGSMFSILFAGEWPYSVHDSATTEIQDSGAQSQAVAFRSTSPTTASTPVTLGMTANGLEDEVALCLAEILASGTIAEDASSPNPIPHPDSASTIPAATTVTTASFTPPSGAVLVAMTVSSNGPVTAVSDSAGTHTWSALVSAQAGSNYSAIWVGIPPAPTVNPPDAFVPDFLDEP